MTSKNLKSPKLFQSQQSKELSENTRLNSLAQFENEAFLNGYHFVAGVDEAGRGPLAGPVVAASCAFKDPLLFKGINDSKLLTASKRQELYNEMTRSAQVSYGVGLASVEEIDAINILEATKLAMQRSVAAMPESPDFILVDAVSFSFRNIPVKSLIRGDQLSYLIGAASILAKVYRDQLMDQYAQLYPHYGFSQHKGYGTALHREALLRWGPTPIHRKSFEPVKSLLR